MAITPVTMPPGRLGAPPPPRDYRHQHEHLWHVAGLQPSPHRSGETIALIVCGNCREPRTMTLTGTWTLAEVAGHG